MILFLGDFSDFTQCMSFLSFSLLKQVENTFVSHHYHCNTGFHTPILINKICKKYKQEPYMIIDTDLWRVIQSFLRVRNLNNSVVDNDH